MAKLKIVEKPVEEIAEYVNNPRKNDKALNAAKRSIESFGFRNPIILNRDGVIIAGHTRLKAAKAAGLEKVPCAILTHLSEEEEAAFRLADNRVGELATWDEDILAEEMSRMGAIDWTEFGFSEKHMKQLQPPEICTCPKCGKTFTKL